MLFMCIVYGHSVAIGDGDIRKKCKQFPPRTNLLFIFKNYIWFSDKQRLFHMKSFKSILLQNKIKLYYAHNKQSTYLQSFACISVILFYAEKKYRRLLLLCKFCRCIFIIPTINKNKNDLRVSS